MRHKGGWMAAVFCIAYLWPAALKGATCTPSATALCLSGQRFSAEVQWKDFQGRTGEGQAVALSADTGYFWFFNDANVELVVKVLDARGLNGHFWVFYGALSNVEYELTVRDHETGDVRIYDNSSGQFASAGDTTAFPPDLSSLPLRERSSTKSVATPPAGPPVDESGLRASAWESTSACTAGPAALCLSGGRFRLEARWKDFQGNTGAGQAVRLTGDTGYFWFFNSSNVEVVVKVLDARGLNDHYWVFYGALSNVEYTLTVTDTVTGIVKTYQNPSGLFASVGDTLAFGKPTTFELIDGAVAKGEIDGETALIDKVYASFGDPRLPPAYQGESTGLEDHGILFEVANRWPTLSAPTQQALQPFLTPPTDPGSWFAQTSLNRERADAVLDDWTRIPTVHSVVWYRAADAGAETAANYLAAEVENVWARETGLMQRSPLGDAAQANNGGDAKLDIYVLPSILTDDPTRKPLGRTNPYPGQPSDQPRSVYIIIRASAASTLERARDVLAHEFFHAIAATIKNGFNGWLNEATAQWMEDYVYPTQIHNLEQDWARSYLTDGYKDPFDQPKNPGYSDYLFFFYIARKLEPEHNRDIWNLVDEGTSPVQAVNGGIPGGFKDRWPEFALYCWNHPDVDRFQVWDNLDAALVDANALPYRGLSSSDGTDSLSPRSVDHLGMSYAFVDVANDSIKRIEIQTQQTGGSPGAKTQAWIKLADGSTRVEDWTSKDRVVFCRDKANEKVTKLLIMYTNSSLDTKIVWSEGKVIYDSVGCGGFRGSARTTWRLTTDGGGSVSETIEVTAEFKSLAESGPLAGHYYAAQLTMRYTYVEEAGCTWTIGPLTRTAEFGLGGNGSEIVIDKTTNPHGYSAAGDYSFAADGRQRCPGGISNPTTGAGGGTWLSIPEGRFTVHPDGSLSGTYTENASGPGGDGVKTWMWNFRPD